MAPLPARGSKIYAMIPGPLGAPADIRDLHVTSGNLNEGGVFGPWFGVQNAWHSGAFRLVDEGVLWTRSTDPVAWTALRAAYALAQSNAL